ncbi:hypothetical protein XBO1_2650015 [Xenorhabdus bovienii str. oregonense]|uniref:Uncharacterized protein n=1 Tax=Xenorhabdus bovienii str. oregonense TaxID=1398202 RepID=A0A077P9H2_XENBV|nr:hypothetical protein XBO1_2650015 [Xenorhabdus bovienii str. oregonense]
MPKKKAHLILSHQKRSKPNHLSFNQHKSLTHNPRLPIDNL